MNKVEDYRKILETLDNWEPFLLAQSGLPGPRGNLELAQAVFLEGDEALFERFLAYDPLRAPANSPEEFLAFCGVFGQGRFLFRDSSAVWERLKSYASDPRWRTREAVAMALQAFGDRDMDGLIIRMKEWAKGIFFEQRATAAALCEPRLLKKRAAANDVLKIIDTITASIAATIERTGPGFKVLRQALGYCWSVAAASSPEEGKKLMEKWFKSEDRDIIWIMKENLSKNRLFKMDSIWVELWYKKFC